MTTKNVLSLFAAISVVFVIGMLIFFFWQDIQGLIGFGSNSNALPKNFRGQPININTSNGPVTIPPVLSDDILSFLKQELTENAGLPLKVERKGNSLPFGIPWGKR